MPKSRVILVVITLALLTAGGIWAYLQGKFGAYTRDPPTLPPCIVGQACEADCVGPPMEQMIGNRNVRWCCPKGYHGAVVTNPGTQEITDVICEKGA